ncbi:MAG: heat-shock protein Hsp20 [Mycobacterium sp.]|jgi:HSP20 family protein|nr:heat-shock protein Hsp20 [Mycobacterium sp.]
MTLPVQRSSSPMDRFRQIRGFDDLYSEMDRLVQSVIGSVASNAWVPAADLTETDDAYVVEIELPGVKREDINVELNGNELVVTGELKERERKGLLRRRTRRVGEFEFRAMLPGDVRDDDVEASLSSGVLTVRVPKAQSTRSSRIDVTESDGHSGS